MGYFYGYAYEDDFIFRNGENGIEVYDPKTGNWVKRYEASELYTGDMPFRKIKAEDLSARLEEQNRRAKHEV